MHITKKNIIILVSIGIMSGQYIYPCHITIKPATLNVKPGIETTVSVYVELEHRRCPIPLEDTDFKSSNIIILKKGKWEKIRRNLYKIDIKLVLKGTHGMIRIVRECDKEGISEGSLKVMAI